MSVVLGIYAGEWLIYHVACVPRLGWAILFNVVWVMAVWSYLQTCMTDPGTVASPEWQEWTELRLQQAKEAQDSVKVDGEARVIGEASGSDPSAPNPAASQRFSRPRRAHTWSPGEVTWCPECSCERPERAHHCSQCGVCVLRMDHHCPWVGSCIGWRNHKHFLLLNWWSFWASLVWLLTLRGPSPLQVLELMSGLGGMPSALPLVGAISVFAFLLITGGMWIYGLSMVFRNLTSVEQLFYGENPYALPSGLDNARQLLGPLDWRLLFPLAPAQEGRPRGTAFPVVPKESQQGAEAPGYGSC